MKQDSVIEAVRQKIAKIPLGKIFGYEVFGELATTRRKALTRALSLLVKREELKRAYTANFYRPDWCKFGAVPIFDAERIKSLGNVYVTGLDAHNMLGISTQILFVITIAHQTKHYRRRLGRLSIKYVRSTLKEIPDDVDAPLLMILDSIKDLKYIQDAMPDDAVRRILWIIKKYWKDTGLKNWMSTHCTTRRECERSWEQYWNMHGTKGFDLYSKRR